MNITLSKGGTAERTILVQSIQIPDLWHLAMAQQDPADRAKILECWHVAHDMRRALQEDPLIAAAPDLLAACQNTHDALFTIKMFHGHLSGSLRDSLTHHIGELSGVISKATGNTIPTPEISANLNQPL